ncbi:hypothetical protein Kpol_1003p26 [Vanderwaltozyma polyspora DSM 70294]|uniref:CS domain-containing protein n=1 Tax=Vanderwaltozyma polyspora (strain ATCC 22028 / DSM 70294 / BCRC 21397 / CBS 2163 / NBRC 10782 / NRRL Y-8283 / UCD 57-17) TaxID=436907 RepID=A7TLY4_VANPO|nr:uncharacterized protein Kpol_1003p26 [Vanderwaltozyma polyspora DSM 70294]EDO16721.1 hypothetical protein Kpol_1003p26 [Vanderwaltozyma polyspora DSM 70294]
MITPAFKVTQDEDFVIINVKISSIRFDAPGMEMVVTGNVFVFHLSPYYLRLRFPHNLVDDERATAEYKLSEETIHIKLPKEERGKVFEDLDFPSKLLAREGDILQADNLNNVEANTNNIAKGPLIQEIGGEKSQSDEVQNIAQLGETFNWEIEQKIAEDSMDVLSAKYGFDNNYNSIVSVSVANGNDINELDEPEKSTADERVNERLRKENLKFDPEYYVSEYMTNKFGSDEDLVINGIKELLQFTPAIVKQYLKWYKNAENKDATMPVDFTEKEQEQMQKNLPNKNYLVQDLKPLYITILNLLFAYVFEQIENEGVQQTESGWTIGKLTPQLCFLDQQLMVKKEVLISENPNEDISVIRAAIIAGIRRGLSYPLHRNFELTKKTWNYVYYILRGGKRLIIKCLLTIHELFRFHDVYYVYNKILLDDLCSWFISSGNENIIRSLAIELKKELDTVTSETINFDCIADFNAETGEPVWENLTLKEMEILSESEYLASLEPN